MSLKYQIIPVTPFEQNATLLWCEQSGKSALIDPGGDEDKLLAAVDATGTSLEKILLTHGHVDHVAAAGTMAQQLAIPVIGPGKEDEFLFDSLPQQCEMFGFPHCDAFRPTQWLVDGDSVSVGDQILEVIAAPGHTPGHLIFFHRANRLVIVGDVLFQRSIGRTDFPQGNHDQLMESIGKRLMPLGDEVKVLPGHGDTTTIGEERRHNPFLRSLMQVPL